MPEKSGNIRLSGRIFLRSIDRFLAVNETLQIFFLLFKIKFRSNNEK